MQEKCLVTLIIVLTVICEVADVVMKTVHRQASEVKICFLRIRLRL